MAEAAVPRRKKRKIGASNGPDSERALKRKRAAVDLATLERGVADLDVSATTSIQAFTDLPLSEATASGLTGAHFTQLTDIQRRAIPLALKGRDILGAAKTGSGKTLAFLVPVLENLLRKKWTEHDGLGALILSPTRELAIQIFQVLRKVGRYHAFSAGLVIGGKDLKDERERLGRMNILVCTPGRMLQHLDQTALFESAGLQMLVLDEADRILDMGFQSTVDAIVEHLPKDRQTLLFSATQTRRVADLARLSLRDPEYVSVHENAASATPTGLQQNYVVVPLPEKLDALWSFLRANVKKKILVFLSSGKQVRFVHESFRHLQPGIPLLHLHGRQKQGTRLDIVTKFTAAQHSCLFATDIVARGLDFPAVDWVIQVDCPEDADTYIHRVGRTARFEKAGHAVMFLDPTEQPGMLRRLKHKKVPIEEIRIRSNKRQSIKSQLQNMCFRDPELKYLGQKAFVSYAKSIHTQRDKEVFDLKTLPMEEYAASLGLPGTPRIKFQQGSDAKKLKNTPRIVDSSDEDDDATGDAKTKAAVRTRYDRMFERVNQDVLTPHYSNLLDDNDDKQPRQTSKSGNDTAVAISDDNSEAGFLTVKRRLSSVSLSSSNFEDDTIQPSSSAVPAADADQATSTSAAHLPSIALGPGKEPLLIDSHRRAKLAQSKKALLRFKERGQKILFDDEGQPTNGYAMQDEAAFRAQGDVDILREQFVRNQRDMLSEQDRRDKDAQRAKRKALLDKRKALASEDMGRNKKQTRDGDEDEHGTGDEDDEGHVPDLVEIAEGGSDIGQDLDLLSFSDDDGDADGHMATVEAKTAVSAGGKKGAKKEKSKKKWFQSSSEDEEDDDNETAHAGGTKSAKNSARNKKKNKKRGRGNNAAEITTLEDLEALAQRYM